MRPADLFVYRPETVASPICCYEKPCPYQGRAVYGPDVQHEGCVNRTVTCLKCNRTGEESVNVEPRS
jgi:hypothetical protein